ncbi:hypothetical protein BsWGS_29184 [Bradybaena similaris]
MALTVCYIVVLSAAILGAPVSDKQNNIDKRSASPVSDTPDQEKDLQELLSLVHKESDQDGVAVHKEQVSHFENNNGEKIQVLAKEEKVVDTKTGKVIADVKQQVKEESAGKNAAPEVVVQTKVDIPAEGVHETFLQQGQENNNEENNRDGEAENDLTPADMAEYLYATQRFPAFYAALERLVNQSKMLPEEAEMYTKAVALEYEKLQLEELEQGVLNEKRFYPQMSQDIEAIGQDSVSDLYPPSNQDARDDSYGPRYSYGYPKDYISPEEQLAVQQTVQDNLGNIDPYEFLAALWNEAYGKGNEEAQEIVKMLYDRVSQDDNPDDMGQIRDLLVETITSSMNDEPYNYQGEAVQATNPETPVVAEVEKKLKEVDAKTANHVTDVKQTEEKHDTKAVQKDEKVKEPVVNKPDEHKQ